MTIPGIGTVNGGMILGEIGDILRFSTPGKLLAFAGLDQPYISLKLSGQKNPCQPRRHVCFGLPSCRMQLITL
ncbi:MAG: transposase [Enterocloster clostridioformis]